MKNYIQYLTIGALLMGSLTSCNDFLDREPLDKVTPEKFFSAEADLAAYAINNYKFVTVDDSMVLIFLEKIMIQIIRQAEQVIRFGFLVRKKLLPTVASGNGRIFVHATTFLTKYYQDMRRGL